MRTLYSLDLRLLGGSMTTEKDLSIQRIVGGIRWLASSVAKDAYRSAKGFGLTGPQASILHAINQLGSMSSAKLSRKLHVTPGNITGIVDRLEKKGLVVRERKIEDRRVVLINLTAEGKQLADVLPDPVEIKLIAGLSQLPPAEIQSLDKAMSHIFEIVDADVEASDDWAEDHFGKTIAP